MNLILIIFMCAILFYIAQVDPAYGFGVLLLTAVVFSAIMIKNVTEWEIEYRKKMLGNPETRYAYYRDINT